jgi:hypothetical protein
MDVRRSKIYLDRWDAALAKSFQAIAADKPVKWHAKATVLVLEEEDIQRIRNRGREHSFGEVTALT